MGKRKQKSDKSLGRDPFEDMEGVGREEAEAEVEAEQADTEVEAVAEVEAVEVEADGEPSAEQAAAEAEVEPATEAEESQVTESTDGPLPVPLVDGGDGGGGEIVAEVDEEASHLLDELIATIDQEVEEAFGPGAMADLEPDALTGAVGEEQYVIFTLAEAEYAVPAANVREIGEPLGVTPVPNVPDWVVGVANLRGDVLSLVDLRLFLGMEQIDYDEDTRAMVVHTEQGALNITTGLMVDLVSDIRYLSVDRIETPTAPLEDRIAPYLRGVYEQDEHLLVVLDLDQLLLSPEMQQFQPV
jgi:purine-binding chemotaxis protein CheW